MTTDPRPLDDEQEEFDEMFLAVRDEIRAMIRKKRGHKALHLFTTEIYDELYMKMRPSLEGRRIDRVHFLGVAGTAIRSLLADAARRKKAQSRGGQFIFVTLKDASTLPYPIEKQLDIDRMLKWLSQEDPELAKFIDMRFFGGCTDEELSTLLDMSTATVQRRVRNGIAWLKLALNEKPDSDRFQ